MNHPGRFRDGGRRDVEDEEGFFEADPGGDTKDDALVQKGVTESRETAPRGTLHRGRRHEGLLDELRRFPEDRSHPFEENPRRKDSDVSTQMSPVHEREPRLGSRKPDRPEPRLHLERRGALGDLVFEGREHPLPLGERGAHGRPFVSTSDEHAQQVAEKRSKA